MSKPDWCPQTVWDEAQDILDDACLPTKLYEMRVVIIMQVAIARAILAAKKRGEEREREACAKIAGSWDTAFMYGVQIAAAIRNRNRTGE